LTYLVCVSQKPFGFGLLPFGSSTSGSLPSGSLPFGSLPSGSSPFGSLPPSGSLPFGSLPFGSLPSGSSPFGSLPSGSPPFSYNLLGVITMMVLNYELLKVLEQKVIIPNSTVIWPPSSL